MTAAVLFIVWLLILAAIIEAGVSNLVTAFRMLKGLSDDAP